MALNKDPDVTDRREVLKDAIRRRAIWEKLRDDASEAKTVLDPRYQLDKAVARNKAKARAVISDTKVVARKAAPAVGVVGLGALIFAARRPIARWISALKPGNK